MERVRRKRKKTYNDPGHAHYVTFSCFQRFPLLAKGRTRQWLVSALDAARHKHSMSFWAYVIMPEHVHVLIWPRQQDYSIAKFLFSCKRPVFWRAKQWLLEHGEKEWLTRLMVQRAGGSCFRFWQAGGGFDRNLVQARGVRAVIDYIHNNPVRRGLVDAPEKWHWSSAGFWAGQPDVALRMDPLEA